MTLGFRYTIYMSVRLVSYYLTDLYRKPNRQNLMSVNVGCVGLLQILPHSQLSGITAWTRRLLELPMNAIAIPTPNGAATTLATAFVRASTFHSTRPHRHATPMRKVINTMMGVG